MVVPHHSEQYFFATFPPYVVTLYNTVNISQIDVTSFFTFQFVVALFAVLVTLVQTKEYSDQDIAALEELREAGVSEVDINELVEEFDEYEAAYYNEDLDEASERGGPRRRRKPAGIRGRPAPSRPTLFQMIQKRFFLSGGGGNRRPSGYGPPKPQGYGPPKKQRPSYHKPKPQYHPRPKPQVHKWTYSYGRVKKTF